MSNRIWWETRRDGEPTNDYLSRVLHELGATELAANALAYHYDDFFCPDEIDDGANIHRLIRDVTNWASATHPQDQCRRDCQLWARVRNFIEGATTGGEFDGTREESRAWGQSAEGQAIKAQFGHHLGFSK